MHVRHAGCRRLATWSVRKSYCNPPRIGRSRHNVEDVVSCVPREAVA